MSGLSILKKRKNIEPFNVHKTTGTVHLWLRKSFMKSAFPLCPAIWLLKQSYCFQCFKSIYQTAKGLLIQTAFGMTKENKPIKFKQNPFRHSLHCHSSKFLRLVQTCESSKILRASLKGEKKDQDSSFVKKLAIVK